MRRIQRMRRILFRVRLLLCSEAI
jgi:hypothetical protein